jgi:hypothetical protein
MLQIFADGPPIPFALSSALEEERLVFFCGAGVSVYTGLPDFEKLALGVASKLKVTPTLAMIRAQEKKTWDKYIGLLEEVAVSGEVRRAIVGAVSSKYGGTLTLHESLLKLSKTSKGFRLVTTNFDRRFIDTNLLQPHHIHAGPSIPIPRYHSWHSVVHLHGLVEDHDTDGQNIIVTSADFGTAYLLDGWASRFIVEVFRDFQPVFIGYSIGDPVVSYLVDALAASNRRGGKLSKGYAFVGAKLEEFAEVRAEWIAKGVEPLIYDNKEGHRLLHETFAEWARWHELGLESRVRIINEVGSRPPNKPDDHHIGQVLWALCDERGATAASWAKMNPPPPLDWFFDVFDKVSIDAYRQGCDDLLLTEISDIYEFKSVSSKKMLKASLVTASRNACTTPLGRSTLQLCGWLTKYLHDPRLLTWVLNKGGMIHPEFLSQIRYWLPHCSMTDGLRKSWTILLAPSMQEA